MLTYPHRRRLLIAAGIAAISAPTQVHAFGQVAPAVASRILWYLKEIGRFVYQIAIAVLRKIMSEKALEWLNSRTERSPAYAVAAYYAMLGERRRDDAFSCWFDARQKHFACVHRLEKITVHRINEVMMGDGEAKVFVNMSGNHYGNQGESYEGWIRVRKDHRQNWKIVHMRELKPITPVAQNAC
jgi:hypothetical protein